MNQKTTEIKVFGETAKSINEHDVFFVKEIKYIEGRKVVILGVAN